MSTRITVPGPCRTVVFLLTGTATSSQFLVLQSTHALCSGTTGTIGTVRVGIAFGRGGGTAPSLTQCVTTFQLDHATGDGATGTACVRTTGAGAGGP